MATSYNGWLASPDPGAISVDTNWSVLGSRPFTNGGFPGGVKSGPVSVIFKYLVTRLHNEVEPMMQDPNTGQIGYGCWGYGYRANVNNPSVLSCHASGTAIDYNAPRHANGTVAPGGSSGWTTGQAEKIRGIIADLSGVVRWLWSNDPMHFEIIGSQEQCAAVAARLGDPGKPTEPEDDMPYSEADLERIIGKVVDQKITGALSAMDTVLRDTYNRTDWTNTRTSAIDTVIRETYNRADWVNTKTTQILAKVSGSPVVEPPTPAPVAPTYTVVPGDTLGAIAKKFGVTVDDLVSWNGIPDPNNISVGQVLRVGKA